MNYWLNLGKQAGVVLGLGLLLGGPVAIVVAKVSGSRMKAVVAGVITAVVALAILAWVYYTVVLCPPSAGCAPEPRLKRRLPGMAPVRSDQPIQRSIALLIHPSGIGTYSTGSGMRRLSAPVRTSPPWSSLWK